MITYHNELNLYPFQQEIVDLAVDKNVTLLLASTGIGKSRLAIALFTQALEKKEVDIVLLVCEVNKLVTDEWPRDLDILTNLDWQPYSGTPAKRAKIREDLPQLLLGSYETFKNDIAIFRKNERGNKLAPIPGPLSEALEGKRVFIIFDEVTRLANRASGNHKAHQLLLNTIRKTEGSKVLAMSATAVERNAESYYNLCRIFVPDITPNVRDFERAYVKSYDTFGVPYKFKNLTPEDMEDLVPPLNSFMAPITLKKNKTDPDVVDFFPAMREMPPTMITLGERQQSFYNTVEDMTDSLSEWEQRTFIVVLRQIAGHPESLITSEGDLAKSIVDIVTPEGLRAIGSAKTERMMSWVQEVVRDQGEQAVIFTFFAQSILPLLQRSLENEGYTVSVNHGKLSSTAKDESKRAFKSGETQIFLTSDSGAKGINLQTSGYVLQYESPSTHASYIQRLNRIHRIDSEKETVFGYSFVARNTIEEGYANLRLRRNLEQDVLQGDIDLEDEDFISADDRKMLLKIGRQKT